MSPEPITLEDVVRMLNEALRADRDATEALLRHRVVCNGELAAHPGIPVVNEGTQDKPIYVIGLMGFINGVFGVRPDGLSYIAAEIDEFSHHVVRFIVAPLPEESADGV